MRNCALCTEPALPQSELCESHKEVYDLRDKLEIEDKHEDMLVRIRRECCDGSTNIEIDHDTHPIMETLLEKELITAKPNGKDEWYTTLTLLGKKIAVLCIREMEN